jgi:hypothetical protein
MVAGFVDVGGVGFVDLFGGLVNGLAWWVFACEDGGWAWAEGLIFRRTVGVVGCGGMGC